MLISIMQKMIDNGQSNQCPRETTFIRALLPINTGVDFTTLSGSVVTNFILTGCDSINLALVLPFN